MMTFKSNRLLYTLPALIMSFLIAVPAFAKDEKASHPLAIHMNQWLEGSREWTTPNPDHDPEDAASFAEYRVRWDWGPFRQQLLGKLFGVRADGSTMLFWNLYATYNPAKRTVVYQQIGLSGAYIQGEDALRTEAIGFGETERLDTAMYAPDGTTSHTRHENVFSANGSHDAKVYEQDENGDWNLKNTWNWNLVSEDEVLGTSF